MFYIELLNDKWHPTVERRGIVEPGFATKELAEVVAKEWIANNHAITHWQISVSENQAMTSKEKLKVDTLRHPTTEQASDETDHLRVQFVDLTNWRSMVRRS